MFCDEVKSDLNFCILLQVICWNQHQALEVSLQMANKAIREMANMSANKKEVLNNL